MEADLIPLVRIVLVPIVVLVLALVLVRPKQSELLKPLFRVAFVAEVAIPTLERMTATLPAVKLVGKRVTSIIVQAKIRMLVFASRDFCNE